MTEGLGGDVPCADCGTVQNPIWWTDHDLWNQIVRPPGYTEDKILCINCFVERTQAVLGMQRWKLEVS